MYSNKQHFYQEFNNVGPLQQSVVVQGVDLLLLVFFLVLLLLLFSY